MRRGVAVCLIFCAVVSVAWEAPDGSRTRAVHLLPLLAENGDEVIPGARLEPPMSMRASCGQCHDYDTIHGGWHFSTAGDSGRPGEPWVLIDEETFTQIPLSDRNWPGTWRPEDLGLTPWDMTKLFGRHTPGGEKENLDPANMVRWSISGQLEINCLACHNAAGDQNMSEWAIELARENFRWAATAASGLAVVDGVASRLPDSYDFYDGPNPDNSWLKPPQAYYKETLFDRKGRVFLDITRRPPDNRCYFCHSTQHVAAEDATPVSAAGSPPGPDVHHAGGVQCTDCHTNGIDHRIERGYEKAATKISCRACHIQEGGNALAGRLGAPIALHKGLPESHFEKLSCTACHSGPMPAREAGYVRTSRANRLGIHGKAQWDTDLPHIVSPVYARDENGAIVPQNMLWPSFWGAMSGDKVTPLPLEVVKSVVERVLADKKAALMAEAEARAKAAAERAKAEASDDEIVLDEGEEGAEAVEESPLPPEPVVALDSSDVNKVLQALAAEPAIDGTPVYVGGGSLYQLVSDGGLNNTDHPVAKACAWPIGHDVRPAAQALGAGGCGDCHSEGSPFFYGSVAPRTPLAASLVTIPMYRFEELDPALLKAWAQAQRGHNLFGIFAGIVIVILALVLVRYGLRGLEKLARLLVAHAASGKK